MKRTVLVGLIIGVLFCAPTAKSFASVLPYVDGVYATGTGTVGDIFDLGYFAAGIYDITASGVVDLGSSPGYSFSINPDGTPNVPVTQPGYNYFNPSGSFNVPNAPPAYQYGAAGVSTTIKIGALMGTFSATPTASDWFLIGYGTTLTLPSGRNIYASVNDNWHDNDSGRFLVDVRGRENPIPEPATMLLLGTGLVSLVGLKLRRKK